MLKQITFTILLAAMVSSGAIAQSRPDISDARNYVLNQRVSALSGIGYSQQARRARIRQIRRILYLRCKNFHQGHNHPGFNLCKPKPPSP
jgi:hypothetical protein